MKKTLITLTVIANLSLLWWGGQMFYQNYQLNQARENLKSSASYTHLKNKLSQWAEQTSLPAPELEFRFNRSNEGFYNPSYGSITILTTLEDWQNLEFLESLLAHEFGHHYLNFRMRDLDPADVELAADYIAKDLVGLEQYTKALSKGLDRGADGEHLDTAKRIEILNQYPNNHILDTN
jgi:uncharacterized protein YjaZ